MYGVCLCVCKMCVCVCMYNGRGGCVICCLKCWRLLEERLSLLSCNLSSDL